MAYNVTSGSGAPQIRAQTVSDVAQPVIHSELQMLLLELKLKTSNNVTKCFGVETSNDKIVTSKMIR